jgi:hypothetical protein
MQKRRLGTAGLEENVAAAEIELLEADLRRLDEAFRPALPPAIAIGPASGQYPGTCRCLSATRKACERAVSPRLRPAEPPTAAAGG